MKDFLIFLIFFVFISCNPFSENRFLKHKKELNNLVTKFEKYNDGVYDTDEFDEFILTDIKQLDIDLVVKNGNKNNPTFSGFTEENDSLIIFIKKAKNTFDKEKRIIYDFHKIPKDFKIKDIPEASYTIKKLEERWYYSEVGFD
ncbi:hypothetical protein B6A10_05450 [Flavobacterium sp. L1I52]|uniref:Lipoprotein n=1 Tax=Flavobacterium pokkalii TaxID=1940408 RepID=A0ABR7UPR4_9FLAO|nr:hypothetical protein [Flavobacterium pokkalii]MBD0724618.1 hypothetical protein [Flavobacterium pokkalii]